MTVVQENAVAVTFEEFEAIFERTKSWGEYSPEKIERGALNHITPETIKAATALTTQGIVVPMSLPWNTVSGPDNHKPALHYMTELGETGFLQPTCNKDFIGVDYHGKGSSHLDAMTHIAFKGQLFGGVTSSEVVDANGSRWSSVDKLGPVVSRGVLLDIALFENKKWIEPGTAVTKEDILGIEKKFNFTIGTGDIVLLRSGHFARRAELGVWDPSNFSSGFALDAIDLFKERKVSVIGADGDSDCRPSPVIDVDSPIHVLALTGLGIPLLDNLQLEPLAATCASLNRWTFTMAISPLNVPGGTGSPVNPIAVF